MCPTTRISIPLNNLHHPQSSMFFFGVVVVGGRGVREGDFDRGVFGDGLGKELGKREGKKRKREKPRSQHLLIFAIVPQSIDLLWEKIPLS